MKKNFTLITGLSAEALQVIDAPVLEWEPN